MSDGITLNQVRAALALEDFDVTAAQRYMAPEPRPMRRGGQQAGSPRQAAVMVLFYPGHDQELTFALLRRTINPHDKHSGQISFPGGSQEVGETAVQTALRETQEEIGVGGPVTIVGKLTSLYIPPSDFDVYPVVGYIAEHPVWHPDPLEVAEILECPVAWLFDETRKSVGHWDVSGFTMRVPWYNVRGHKVWGATAIILSELEHRLRQTLV